MRQFAGEVTFNQANMTKLAKSMMIITKGVKGKGL